MPDWCSRTVRCSAAGAPALSPAGGNARTCVRGLVPVPGPRSRAGRPRDPVGRRQAGIQHRAAGRCRRHLLAAQRLFGLYTRRSARAGYPTDRQAAIAGRVRQHRSAPTDQPNQARGPMGYRRSAPSCRAPTPVASNSPWPMSGRWGRRAAWPSMSAMRWTRAMSEGRPTFGSVPGCKFSSELPTAGPDTGHRLRLARRPGVPWGAVRSPGRGDGRSNAVRRVGRRTGGFAGAVSVR